MPKKILVGHSAGFLAIAKELYQTKAKTWSNVDEEFEVIIVDKPTNFSWHQRIFPEGLLLHKLGTNVRIFIEKEKLI